jgi:hypothetical protein
LASARETTADFLSFRFRFRVFDVSKCPDDDFLLASLPDPVFLKRLAADLLVLTLGTIPILLSHYAFTAVGCVPLSLVSHTTYGAAELASYSPLAFRLLQQHVIRGTRLILKKDLFVAPAQ